MLERPLAGIASISLFCLALALFHTRQVPLIDRDEGRYAEAAREMVVSGDWLAPRLFGVPYLEKPPLYYWLTAAAFRLFGENELGARVVSAVASAAAVLATALFGRRVFGAGAGLAAGIVLATSGMQFLLARVAITDMLFSTLVASALMAYFLAESERRSFLPFWSLAAAATLTKGPVAALLCALPILGHLAVLGDARTLRSARFWAGLPLYLAVVASWFALVEVRYPGFLSFYVYKEHVLRAAGDEHRHALYWYLPWLLIGFLPWTPIGLAALPAIRRRIREDSRAGVAARFTVIWAALIFAFFSIPRGKLAQYLLPIFPAFALLVGDALARWMAEREAGRGVTRAFSVVGWILLVGAVAMPIAARFSPVPISTTLVAVATASGALVALMLLAVRRIRGWQPLLALAAAIAVLECVAAIVASRVAYPLTVQPVLAILRQRMTQEDEIVSYGGYFPDLPFYLRRIPYFVFGNRELDFGVSLEGGGPWVVDDLGLLLSRLPARRVFFVLRTRERDLQTLSRLPGTVQVLLRGRSSSLIEYRR